MLPRLLSLLINPLPRLPLPPPSLLILSLSHLKTQTRWPRRARARARAASRRARRATRRAATGCATGCGTASGRGCVAGAGPGRRAGARARRPGALLTRTAALRASWLGKGDRRRRLPRAGSERGECAKAGAATSVAAGEGNSATRPQRKEVKRCVSPRSLPFFASNEKTENAPPPPCERKGTAVPTRAWVHPHTATPSLFRLLAQERV